jgi:flavin-dependent dehydrogenase
METSADVLICGAGLAGLTLARQLRRQHPGLEILVVDKTSRPLPDAAHKVGESTVELGSQYLERLGLGEYLRERHLLKFGLRFYPGGGQLPLEKRTEIGPSSEPIVRSYQIDRGRFESDLRAMIVADGVELLEGHEIGSIDLGEGEESHRAELQGPSGPVSVRARWLVDATGRNALLRRKLKLTRGTRHASSSGWFRVAGKVDINDWIPDSARAPGDEEFASSRWRSTNHLMGSGYWVWIIPLSTGNTSIGVVTHPEYHDSKRILTLDRVREFIEEQEPQLAERLTDHEVLDFMCIRDYSHTVGRSWSADRWGIVGEAGAFPDPLYSPGTDFIAIANSFTEELIRADLAGDDLEKRTRELNIQYRALVSGCVDVFREAAPIYGHAPAMVAKIYWDNYAYWSFLCQYYLQEIYRLSGPAHTEQVDAGQRFIELSNYVQKLLREWALLSPHEVEPFFHDMPAFPSVLVDSHVALQEKMTPAETLEYIRSQSRVGEKIVAELVVRAVSQLGEAKAKELASRVRFDRWTLRIPADRIRAEKTTGLGRRRALTPLARDVERSIGRLPSNTDEEQMLAILRPLLSESEERHRVRAEA